MKQMRKWLKKFSGQSRDPNSSSRDSLDEDKDLTPTNMTFDSMEVSASSVATLGVQNRLFAMDLHFMVKHMKCSSCEKDLVPPIQMCSNGHSSCRFCKCFLTNCTLCLEPLTTTRNLILEELCAWARYFCPAMGVGCSERLPEAMISEHTRYCKYREMKCPVNESIAHCPWKGYKVNLAFHLKYHHPTQICKENVFTSKTVDNECKIIPFKNEVFVFHKLFCETDWFCIVESAGLTKKKYRCTFQLSGNNGVDNIVLTLPVCVMEQPLGHMYKSAKGCLRLPGVALKYFIADGKMDLEVSIRDVTALSNP